MKVLIVIGCALGAILLGFGLAVMILWVSGLPVDMNREYKKDSRYYRALLNGWTGFVLWFIRVRIHPEGLDQLPQSGRFLLVANHRSKFDPIVTWYVLRHYDISFISKPENFKIPFFGPVISRCCFLAIDRENPRKALCTITAAGELMKNGTVSVGVYPEGTRNTTDAPLLPFHNGVFKAAQDAGVPVAVLVTEGTEQIRDRFIRRRTDITFRIVRVFSSEEVAAMKRADLAGAARAEMLRGLGKTE